MKKKFTIAGATVGASFGIGVLVVSYAKAPGVPGFYEALIQLALVFVLAAPTAFVGFLMGCIASSLLKKKNENHG